MAKLTVSSWPAPVYDLACVLGSMRCLAPGTVVIECTTVPCIYHELAKERSCTVYLVDGRLVRVCGWIS